MVKQLANKGAAGDLKAIPLVMNEIRLREGLTGSDQTEAVRAEDQMVIDSIVTRIRSATEAPAEKTVVPEPSADPQQNPTQTDQSEDTR